MDISLIKNHQTLIKLRAILKKRLVLYSLQVFLIVAAITLAIFSLSRNHKSTNFSHVNIWFLVGGVITYLIFYLFFSVHWSFALSIVENRKIDRKQILAFFASQPYKYLPTSAFSVSSRSLYSVKLGAHKISTTAGAQLSEYGSLFASGLLIMVLTRIKLPMFILVPTVLLIFLSLSYVAIYLYRDLRKSTKYLVLISISLVSWIIGGLSFFFVLHGVNLHTSFEDAVYLNDATFLASIAAVLVPAGIGIREAILFSQNIGFSGVLVWRIISVVVDVMSGAFAIVKINKRKT